MPDSQPPSAGLPITNALCVRKNGMSAVDRYRVGAHKRNQLAVNIDFASHCVRIVVNLCAHCILPVYNVRSQLISIHYPGHGARGRGPENDQACSAIHSYRLLRRAATLAQASASLPTSTGDGRPTSFPLSSKSTFCRM